eukprot:351801-Chlamydomonas_euryale.AAC.3
MACNEESDGEGSSRKHKLPATGFSRPYAARGAQLRPTSRAATSTAISVAIRDRRMTKRSSGALQGGPHNQSVDFTTVGTLHAPAAHAKKSMSGSSRAFASTAAQQQGAGRH